VATTTDDLKYVSFPIIKSEEDAEGNLIVYGKATDGSVDSDLQIVDPQGSADALRKWLDTGGNVRVQHNPKLYPAGKGLEVETTPEGHFVKSLVVEDTAKKLVRAGVLRAYSVGIAHPIIERDMTGKARGGVIKFGDNTEICEISLVDRPANRNCGITLVKSADKGDEDWTYGDLEALLAQAEGVTKSEGEPQDEVPAWAIKSAREMWQEDRQAWLGSEPSVEKSHSGTDYLIARAAWQKWSQLGEDYGLEKADDESFVTWIAKRKMDPDVGGGVDRDKIPAEDFAGKDRSFPIVTPQDVADAARSLGRAGSDNYSTDQIKANIIRIAKRKGAAFEAKLPDAWKTELPDIEKAKGKKKPAFQGAAKPFGKEDADGKDSDGDGKDVDEKPATKGAKDCPKCGHDYDADSPAKRCESCGTKLKATKSTKAEKLLQQVIAGLMTIDDARALMKGDSLMPGSGLDAGPGKTKPTSMGEQGGDSDPTMKPAGDHREPDGTSTVEVLEPQMGRKTDPDPVADKVPASVKSEPSYGVRRMHDALCAVYHENSVKAVYPSLDTIADAIDPNFWRDAAAEADRAGKAKKTARLRALADTAEAVKSVDRDLLSDARAELSKMFMDSYPNINLTPAAPPQPGQFRRPFIGTGHALMKPSGSPRIPSSTHTPDPDDFSRSPLTAGQERPSPGNKGGNNPSFGAHSGVRGFYPSASREATRNALQNLHDQIAKTYPDMCALAPAAGPIPPAGMNSGATPTPVNPPNQGRAPGEKTVDPQLIKSLVAQEVSTLRDEYEQKISKMQAEIDKLGSQADETQAPPRGAVRKPAEPVAPVEKAAMAPIDIEAQERRELIAYLVKTRDHAPRGEDREKARAVLEKMLAS
jgi:phage head maturation protease